MWTIIKDKTQYNIAFERLLKLAEMDLVENSSERDEFDLLSLLIKHYEDNHLPKFKSDPIRQIKFAMEQKGLTNKDMTAYLGSLSKVSEVLNYKKPLSLSMIRKLHKGLGIPSELLIQEYALQQDFSKSFETIFKPLIFSPVKSITLRA